MKKMIGLLCVMAMMVGLLSGCIEMPLSKEERIARDIQTAEDNLNGFMNKDAWKSVSKTVLSMSGKDFDLETEETSTAVCKGYGTKDMAYHATATVKMGELSEEQTYHYEDGIGYVNSPAITRGKGAMDAETFIKFASAAWEDEDINPDETKLGKGGKREWNTEDEKVSTMTLTETSMLRLPLLLKAFGLEEEHVLVQKYENKSEYVFDKELNPVSSGVHIQCEFEAFGDIYVVSLKWDNEYVFGNKAKVDELPAKDNYTEREDLLYYQAFLSAYTNAAKLKDYAFDENETFSISVLGSNQKYELNQKSTISQNISVEDVRLKKELKGKYTVVNYYGQKGTSEYTQAISIKEGKTTTAANGEASRNEDWINPMSFYQTAATGLWGVHYMTEDDVKTVSFLDNGNGKIVCFYKMSADLAKKVANAVFGYLLDENSAAKLAAAIEEDDFSNRSGKLTFDLETGAILSFEMSVEFKGSLYEGKIKNHVSTCYYHYQMSATPVKNSNDKTDAA